MYGTVLKIQFFFVCVCLCPGELLFVWNSFKNTVLWGFFYVQESFYLYGTFLKIQFCLFFFFVFGFLREFCQTFKAQVIQSIVGARFILLAMYLIKKIFFNQPDGYFVLRAILQISSLSFYQR